MTNSYRPIGAHRAVANQYTIAHDVETQKIDSIPRSYLEFHEIDIDSDFEKLKEIGDPVGNLILDVLNEQWDELRDSI